MLHSNAARPLQIYVADAIAGNTPTRLTKLTYGRDVTAAWSPDGAKIAFTSTRDGNFEIYVMDADGSDPKRLTDHAARDYGPVWSPDGQRILFTSERYGDRSIFVMNADGSGVTDLSVNKANDDTPAWSLK